jgi:hypothetical protein
MYLAPSANVNGAIKCQHISGGDGFATMGDGTQTYMFSFGPLSGLYDIAQGQPGTQFPNVFNTVYSGATPLMPGDPATTGVGFTYNGAVGQVPDIDAGNIIDGYVDLRPIMDVGVMNGNIPAPLMAIRCDSGRQRYRQVSGGRRVLSLHPQSRSPLRRRRELWWADD